MLYMASVSFPLKDDPDIRRFARNLIRKDICDRVKHVSQYPRSHVDVLICDYADKLSC